MLQQKYSEKLQTALNLNIPVARFIPINNAAMNIPGEIVIEANCQGSTMTTSVDFDADAVQTDQG
jgi:hypothetical protein